MSEIRDDDNDFLAAEYALGVLDGADRRRAERLARQDTAFAAELAEWNARLAPMASRIADVAPPAGLWAAIEGDLDRMTRVQSASRRAEPRAEDGGRGVSRLWQWLSLGSMAVAAASLAALFIVARPAVREPLLTASLAGDNGVPLFTAVVDRRSGTATLIPVSQPAMDGKVPELWLIPPGGVPQSLGVVDPAKPLRVALPAELAGKAAASTALAISLEPQGGSPTGRPTGPVVAKGALLSL